MTAKIFSYDADVALKGARCAQWCRTAAQAGSGRYRPRTVSAWECAVRAGSEREESASVTGRDCEVKPIADFGVD